MRGGHACVCTLNIFINICWVQRDLFSAPSAVYYLTYFWSARWIFDLNWIYIHIFNKAKKTAHTRNKKNNRRAIDSRAAVVVVFRKRKRRRRCWCAWKAPNEHNKRNTAKIPETKYQISWVQARAFSAYLNLDLNENYFKFKFFI